MKSKLFVLLLMLALLSACTAKKNAKSELDYLQNIEQVATEAAGKNAVNTIQPGDQLVIMVSGKDADVARPFNQNYSSGETLQNVQPGGNLTATVPAISGPTYIVDSEGNIDFPYLGRINTSNRTLEDLRDDLRTRLSRYILSPGVSVRLANYKVTVLGEVARPGQYTVPDGQSTMFGAIGMAGDLTMYGRRDNVLLIRNVNGELTKQRINLSDASFMNSPYYHLKQGDVIYVSPNATRDIAAKQNPNTGLYISIASVALGLLGLLVTVFKK